MTLSYFAWHADAENAMDVNHYYVRHEYQNENLAIRLFGNRETDAFAITKSWKETSSRVDTLVMMFDDKKEAEQKFREMIENELLGLY